MFSLLLIHCRCSEFLSLQKLLKPFIIFLKILNEGFLFFLFLGLTLRICKTVK
jgi:hypothetical protein